MTTIEREVTIPNKYGLHARPAMQIVELANGYTSKVEVSNGPITVDAKSIMSVMRLAATQGAVLKIVADGHDAEQAAAVLVQLVENGFGEMKPDEASTVSSEE